MNLRATYEDILHDTTELYKLYKKYIDPIEDTINILYDSLEPGSNKELYYKRILSVACGEPSPLNIETTISTRKIESYDNYNGSVASSRAIAFYMIGKYNLPVFKKKKKYFDEISQAIAPLAEELRHTPLLQFPYADVYYVRKYIADVLINAIKISYKEIELYDKNDNMITLTEDNTNITTSLLFHVDDLLDTIQQVITQMIDSTRAHGDLYNETLKQLQAVNTEMYLEAYLVDDQ